VRDTALHDLARAAGISVHWQDYLGRPSTVSAASLRAVLSAIGYAANSPADIAASREHLLHTERKPPALVTATAGQPVRWPGATGTAVLHLEDGTTRNVTLAAARNGYVRMRAPDEPGYHRLQCNDTEVTLAVAPLSALTVTDVAPHGASRARAWGVAVQLYALNSGGDFGDFDDLAQFCRELAGYGADAVAISPTHALFSADRNCFAPYGPSTRLFLNPLYIGMPRAQTGTGPALIDWPAAAVRKSAALHDEYQAFRATGTDRPAFERFVTAGGAALLAHARFEFLDARFRPQGFTHWRDWPQGYTDANEAGTTALSAADPEIEFFLYLQWRAGNALAAAQQAARDAGMRIGLIADLAVGMDGAGSHAWSRPQDLLTGLSIGAPPDLLAPQGQSWGLTGFSPAALRATGYAPFLATLRAALRHCGGVRIDHAIGLQRLWVTPEGRPASEGAYLAYPFADLMRLIGLESYRKRAIVIGEDLGTVPPGFRAKTTRAGISGMRVLWFERTASGNFRAPAQWDRTCVAMTTTHDLPTVAGWWRGRDIAWRARIDSAPEVPHERQARASDRTKLWQSMVKSGAARDQEPPPENPGPAVAAALNHVAGSACDLALIAIEDIVGLDEQPNLPGTTDQHPNWRRRLPPGNGMQQPQAVAALRSIDQARRNRA
jgi:4-alpha-glucanotransferase